MIKPVIVCVAKLEGDYIEEWVKYHLALGITRIYLYDNEDTSTYHSILRKYADRLTIHHIPHNNRNQAVQYTVLDHFAFNYYISDDITHIIHIDIDEFIVLKKHANIIEFIEEYITGDCAGIGMNWRFFGSSGHLEKSNEPVTQRFTRCDVNGNMHIKTIFNKTQLQHFCTPHNIKTQSGYHIKSTNGDRIVGPFNYNIDHSVIQLNHYKSKTLPEFRYIRSRGRADMVDQPVEDIEALFAEFDRNECEDFTARDFYKNVCNSTA